MDYSEDMATSIADIKNMQNQQNNGNNESHASNNLGQMIEQQYDNLHYNPNPPVSNINNVPQNVLQNAPPMRQGKLEQFPVHKHVKANVGYQIPQHQMYQRPKKNIKNEEKYGFIQSIVNGLYQRIIDPLVITLLFIILSHRSVAKYINPYLPFVGLSPSTDYVSLGIRGFILSILYLIFKSYL